MEAARPRNRTLAAVFLVVLSRIQEVVGSLVGNSPSSSNPNSSSSRVDFLVNRLSRGAGSLEGNSNRAEQACLGIPNLEVVALGAVCNLSKVVGCLGNHRARWVG